MTTSVPGRSVTGSSVAAARARAARPGAGVAAAHAALRARVAHMDADRSPSPDIAAARELVHSGELLANGATQRAHA